MLKVCLENSIFLLELYLKLFMGKVNVNIRNFGTSATCVVNSLVRFKCAEQTRERVLPLLTAVPDSSRWAVAQPGSCVRARRVVGVRSEARSLHQTSK